jgi:hypothetical protein
MESATAFSEILRYDGELLSQTTVKHTQRYLSFTVATSTLVILTIYKPIKIWFALVFASSTSNIVSRLPENFWDRAAILAVIQSRPMT